MIDYVIEKLKWLCYALSFRQHLILSIIIRLALIWYGQYHDQVSEVPYTDIDYKVVTDGARYVLEGGSPFDRHTFRYSPILAYLQLPNLLLHLAMGKVIYSFFDILVACLIYSLVYNELKYQCRSAIEALLLRHRMTPPRQYTDARNRAEVIAQASGCFWLYNPLTAVISTRGNGDSFASFFVVLSLFLLVKSEYAENVNQKRWLVFAAGLVHGFAIHLRLYPLLFSLAFYLCLSDDGLTRNLWQFLRQLFRPTLRQTLLVLGTLLSFASITWIFFKLYGWQYIYEAYLYHFLRKDLRHNFSVYFLMQYLSGGSELSFAQGIFCKCLTLAPQLFLLLYLSLSFGQFRQTLPFCIFSLAFVLVTFNTVVTSQYFVWYLALLPLCLNNLLNMKVRRAAVLALIWLLAQALWLMPAYLLEFKSWNTFYWIGLQGLIFFLVNNILLTCMIQNYSFTTFKVNYSKLL